MSATAAGELAGTTVLLVDDDTAHREALAACLARAGAAVSQAADGRQGLSSFRETLPDLVVADLRMPRMDGLEMTAGVKAARPGTPVVLITAYGDSHALARAIELGVDGFVPKPIDVDVLLRTVGRCALPIRQRHEIEALTRCAAASLEGRLGPSAAMLEVRETVRLVAASSFSVLLQGDTGVGKSHVARVVHELSPRSGAPFVHVDLGSIPETLVEGELLGVRRGAYTGADRDRPGRLEAAGRGTLFLDELSSIPPSVQAKLLQAVEERRYTPLGARAPVALEARILSAVQGDARTAVREKRLRDDLFFRLAEVELVIAPLRERPEDVVFLARRFAADAADELGRRFSGLSREAEEYLVGQPWPGNVRQLRNEVRRAVLLSPGDLLSHDAFRLARRRAGEGLAPATPQDAELPRVTLAELERRAFEQALRETGQTWAKAAQLLGLDYSTFRRRLRRHGLDPDARHGG